MTRIAQVRKDFAADQRHDGHPDPVGVRPEGRRRQDDDRVQPRGRHRPARAAHRPHRRQPPVRRPARAAQGAVRRAVDPRPADRPDRRVGPGRRPVARPVGHRHPARAAADRDGRDGHAARPRQDPVAAAPRLRRRSSSTCRATSTTSTSRSSTRATRSSRSSPTTRRRSTTRSPWPTRSARSATRRRKVHYLVNRADSPGGIDPDDLERALGRVPEHRVVSDGRSSSSRTTRACRSCWPTRTRRSARTSCGSPSELLGAARVAAGAARR